MDKNEFLRQVSIDGTNYNYYDINLLEQKGIADISRLPFSIRILVENLLRKLGICSSIRRDLNQQPGLFFP